MRLKCMKTKTKTNAKWMLEHYYLFIARLIDYKKKINGQQALRDLLRSGLRFPASNEKVDFWSVRWLIIELAAAGARRAPLIDDILSLSDSLWWVVFFQPKTEAWTLWDLLAGTSKSGHRRQNLCLCHELDNVVFRMNLLGGHWIWVGWVHVYLELQPYRTWEERHLEYTFTPFYPKHNWHTVKSICDIYSSVIFDKCLYPCTWHFKWDGDCFLCQKIHFSPFPVSILLPEAQVIFASSETSYKWNHKVCIIFESLSSGIARDQTYIPSIYSWPDSNPKLFDRQAML